MSPGQWGSVAFFAFLMACLGGVVVNRASRSDVTYAFIVFYCALLFGRSCYLGEPFAIPLHRLQGGALLLFTFFMISDPKTTPGFPRRPRAVRGAGRVRRLVRAVPTVQDQRPAVVAGGVFADGSAHRSGAARREIQLALAPAPHGGWTSSKEQRHDETISVRGGAGAGDGVVGATAAWLLRLLLAKADTKLFNKASQVVLVRDGDRTVMTMAQRLPRET